VYLGNITNYYIVPTTPNTRIHKDHPIDNVIGEVQSTLQTRRMSKSTSEQGFLSNVYEQKTHDTLNTCFLLQIEPTSIAKALSDSSRVEAMQEELLRIDYEEVFAPVARIKAIRLFLAYASFMGFLVYQMDVKSAFLYGTIEEEVYVTQPPGFKDPDHPGKVYKVSLYCSTLLLLLALSEKVFVLLVASEIKHLVLLSLYDIGQHIVLDLGLNTMLCLKGRFFLV
ncbi:putative ribonuclease H-like domain-containing protein, partial [Tanacetum coccineum]